MQGSPWVVRDEKSSKDRLAKLLETAYHGWMIACFQEVYRISRRFETDFYGVMDFLEDSHPVRFDRPIMFPDVIGGHCLIPNVELFLKSVGKRVNTESDIEPSFFVGFIRFLGMLNSTPSVMRMSSRYLAGIYSACASSRLFALSRRPRCEIPHLDLLADLPSSR